METDLALDTLDGIDDDGDGALGQGLETLLRIDVDAREPAAEARMRVVPADHHLGPARLPQHVQHLGLEHGVHRFHAHTLETTPEMVKCKVSKVKRKEGGGRFTVPDWGIAKTSMTRTV